MPKCAECQYEATSDLEFQIHNASAHLFYYQCKFCQKAFVSRYLVARHLVLEHNAYGEQDLKGTWLELKDASYEKAGNGQLSNQLSKENICSLLIDSDYSNHASSKNLSSETTREISLPRHCPSRVTVEHVEVADSTTRNNIDPNSKRSQAGTTPNQGNGHQYIWLQSPNLTVHPGVNLAQLSSVQPHFGNNVNSAGFKLPQELHNSTTEQNFEIKNENIVKEESVIMNNSLLQKMPSKPEIYRNIELNLLKNSDIVNGVFYPKRTRSTGENSNLNNLHGFNNQIGCDKDQSRCKMRKIGENMQVPSNHANDNEEAEKWALVDPLRVDNQQGTCVPINHTMPQIQQPQSQRQVIHEAKISAVADCPFCLEIGQTVSVTDFYGHVRDQHSTIFRVNLGETLANNLERLNYIDRRQELQKKGHFPCPICNQEMKVTYIKIHLERAHKHPKFEKYWDLILKGMKHWSNSYRIRWRELKNVKLHDLKTFALCAPFCPKCTEPFHSWDEVFQHADVGKSRSCQTFQKVSFDLECEFCPIKFYSKHKLKDHTYKHHRQHYESFMIKFNEDNEKEWDTKLDGFPERCAEELKLFPQCHLCGRFYNDWFKVDRHLFSKHQKDIHDIWHTGALEKPLLSEEQIQAQKGMHVDDETAKKMDNNKGNPVNPLNRKKFKSSRYQCLICFEHYTEENLYQHIREDHNNENGPCLANYLEDIRYIQQRDGISRTCKVYCPFCKGLIPVVNLTLSSFQNHTKYCQPNGIDWPMLIALLDKLSRTMQAKVNEKLHTLDTVVVPSVYITFVLGLPKCLYCSQTFPSWQNALAHMVQMDCEDHSKFKADLSKYLTCIECNKQAGSRATLITHSIETHKKTSDMTWLTSVPEKECPICLEKFVAHVNLLRHLQVKHFPKEKLIVDENELILDKDSYLGTPGRIQIWFEALEHKHADSVEENEMSRWCVLCMKIFKGDDLYTHLETEHILENGPVFAKNLKRIVDYHSFGVRPMKVWTPCPFCLAPYDLSRLACLFKHMKEVHSKSKFLVDAIKRSYGLWLQKLSNAETGRKGFKTHEIRVLTICTPQCYMCQEYFDDWDSVSDHVSKNNCSYTQ